MTLLRRIIGWHSRCGQRVPVEGWNLVRCHLEPGHAGPHRDEAGVLFAQDSAGDWHAWTDD